MPAPETSRFVPWSFERVVATPAAIDRLVAAHADRPGIRPIRLADDEVMISESLLPDAQVDDAHAISEVDQSFHVLHSPAAAMVQWIGHLLEWPIPTDGSTAQGLLFGVPVKLGSSVGGDALALLCPTALVHELEERLG